MTINCEDSTKWSEYHRRAFQQGLMLKQKRNGTVLRQDLGQQKRVVWAAVGDGMSDNVIDTYPQCLYSGDYVSANMCRKECPNHYFADLAYDLSRGFSYGEGDPPTAEEMHAMLMAFDARGWWARDLAQLRVHIAGVLTRAGATIPSAEGATDRPTMDKLLDLLARAYFKRKRRTRSESMHWLFLKRMRSLVARMLVGQALDAIVGQRCRSDQILLLTPSSDLRVAVDKYLLTISVPSLDAVWFEIRKNGK
jgi:hypothetical protein